MLWKVSDDLMAHWNSQGTAEIRCDGVFFDIGGAVLAVQLTLGRDDHTPISVLQDVTNFFEHTETFTNGGVGAERKLWTVHKTS